MTSGPVTDLRLNENVLSWTDSDDGVYVLDLDHEDSEPVDSGLRAPYQVDDGLIAGINPDGEIQIQALPFASGGGDSTLISGLAPKKVARARTTWAAQFDVTRPVTDVKVSIRRDGRVIRTLTMPGRYGLINVTWNGRTGSGRKVRPGGFRWAVTGRTPDGHRLSPIRGQLTVT